MRPGRLDRILYVGPPDQNGREEIMRIRTKHMKVEDNLDVSQIATLVCEQIPCLRRSPNGGGTDGRLFRSGNFCPLSRSRAPYDAEGY